MLSAIHNTNSHKLIMSIVILIIILGILVLVFYSQFNKIASENDGIKVLDTEFTKITNEREKADPEYIKAKNLFNDAALAKTSDEKYKNLVAASEKVQLIYSTYNNKKLYKYINEDLASYAKGEFPDQYNANSFDYPCQDPSCAESEQPKEILAIVEDIKKSDIPQFYKDNFIRNLINTGYESGSHSKAWQYYATARSFEASSDLSPSGANLVISNDIKAFLKSTYPEDFKLFQDLEESKSQQ